jgi:hypothetical protein
MAKIWKAEKQKVGIENHGWQNHWGSHAGTPGAHAGVAFVGPLPSKLADGPSKNPLDSLRE